MDTAATEDRQHGSHELGDTFLFLSSLLIFFNFNFNFSLLPLRYQFSPLSALGVYWEFT